MTFPHPMLVISPVLFCSPIPRLFPQLMPCVVQHVGRSLISLPPPPPFPLYVPLYCKRSKTGDETIRKLALSPGVSTVRRWEHKQLHMQIAWDPYPIPYTQLHKPSSSEPENEYSILTTHVSPFGESSLHKTADTNRHAVGN